MRLIVILSREPEEITEDPTRWMIRAAYRLPVPAWARAQFVDPKAASIVPDESDPLVVKGLKTGAIIELLVFVAVPRSGTMADRRAAVEQDYQQKQAQLTQRLGTPPWALYGSSWDGTTWTAGT